MLTCNFLKERDGGGSRQLGTVSCLSACRSYQATHLAARDIYSNISSFDFQSIATHGYNVTCICIFSK